jgi:chaperonin GroEL
MMQHEDPLVLVTDYKISAVDTILPILEMCARESRPLVIVAEELEGQALAAMIMNAMRGTLKVAGIKAPSYGEERRQILDDLALSTGATFISRESGLKLSEVKMSHLGSADFVESTKYQTTFVGGSSNHEQIEERSQSLKALIDQTDSMQECDHHQGRLVRLLSGVAVIRVGGSTEVEMTEKKHRIEDALEAVKSAQDEGLVAGGGTALLRASQTMCIITEGSHPDQGHGAAIVQMACRDPIKQMALNAGESPDIIVDKVLNSDAGYGWDFNKGRVVDLIKSGIVDPVKVTKAALKNASSCAGTLITTNYGIIQTENN